MTDMKEAQDYILTHSRVRFTPLAPNAADIKLVDIAHSLSLLCRANGHYPRFFSVAQHCLNCEAEARTRGYSKKLQLACLLHDASEAYISDITRPVKKNLLEYIAIENKLQKAIWRAFNINLSQDDLALVFEVDDAMLYAEFDALMGEKLFPEPFNVQSTPDFFQRDSRSVEQEFVMDCMALMG
jgi:hypothetical protein